MSVGGQAIKMFIEMLEDKFSEYMTDFRFHALLTVYKGIEAGDEMRERFRASPASTTLTPNLEREECSGTGDKTAFDPDSPGV